jgi:DNA polymerase-1
MGDKEAVKLNLLDTDLDEQSQKYIQETLESWKESVTNQLMEEVEQIKAEKLEELEEENPIIKEILAYRELQKLLSTYIDVIPKMVGKDGRLHAKFLQNGSSTGRFSSQDPNLQNLPIKTELGKRIRNGFIATDGYKLCAFDYSQIELRVAAILSGDKKMTQIFKEGKDIHAGVASFVFGVPIEKVDSEMRRVAKIINFGILYGMGVTALRKNLGGTRLEAQKFYDNYFNQFSGVRDYLEEVKKFAEKNSYTETLFGRRRNFPNINSKIPFLKSMAERTAINAPIQGTATADIIKLAIRYADEDLKKEKLLDKVHLVLQIHDELVYEIDESVLEKATKIIKDAMQGVLSRSFLHYKTDIPLLVHFGFGDNLGEAK